jgi:YVTN family beta-propeller protein
MPALALRNTNKPIDKVLRAPNESGRGQPHSKTWRTVARLIQFGNRYYQGTTNAPPGLGVRLSSAAFRRHSQSTVKTLSPPLGIVSSARFLSLPAVAALSCVLYMVSLCRTSAANQAETFATSTPVGQLGSNLYSTPVNQLLTPAGRQLELTGLRPQALALSPNGRLLTVAGKTHELVVLDPLTASIKQRLPLPARDEQSAGITSTHILEPDTDAQLSYTGIIFTPDGERIFVSSINGSIKVFAVDAKDRIAALQSFPLPPANAPHRKIEIPAGLAISKDGKKLYVALSLSNRLLEMDAETGRTLRVWEVGFAPFDVKLAGEKAYVSNWGGRRPGPDDLTGPAGKGTRVRVDPVRHIASEGSVSVVDLGENKVLREIVCGLHTSALALTPNGRYLAVANAASDTLSVIDTRSDEIIETICTRQNPADLFGAGPNALTFDRSGEKLFVCNGSQNAVAVIAFAPRKSKLEGLIPVGWFPGAIVFDQRRESIYVGNIKGIGSGKTLREGESGKFTTSQHRGTVSFVPLPSKRDLAGLTDRALRNLRAPLLKASRLPARAGQPPRPVPERAGEPSVFKHVVYIIKENRTFDQILGDVKEGKGDPSLCVFGERFTPNQHKMVKEFVLLDNTCCSGVVSSDGHQWATTAITTDYMERSFAGFPRSYPDGMEDDDVDALAYSPAGFIWDNAIAHHKSLRDYGEFAITDKEWRDGSTKKGMKFRDIWHSYTNGDSSIGIGSHPAIGSLGPYLCTNTVGWDLDIPDVFRAKQFIAELRNSEINGEWPNLMIVCLPNDHTSGTKAGHPTPGAQVADNDVAFGQIVEAISHSKFWPETCIFAIEDDPQNGWDHVSAYRTTAYVISPYTKRGEVVSTQYNQTSLLRTIELIVGLPPMNQMDATATPMFDCFTMTQDLRTFTAVSNNIALDEMNPDPKKISNALMRKNAVASDCLPLERADQCPEDVLNRIIWHAMKGPQAKYPDWAVSAAEDND